MLLLAAVPAIAQDNSGDGPKYGPGYTPETIADYQRLQREFDRRAAQRRQWLTGPEAAADRARSRTAHRGLSAAEARDLLSREFDGALARTDLGPLEEKPGVRAVDYLSDTAARITRDDGTRRLVVSLGTPLRTNEASGEGAAVDLGLSDKGAAFEPLNPVVDLRLPKRSSRNVEVGSQGVAFALERAPGAGEVDAERIGAGVLYPNVIPDTDLFVKPTPGGLESFTQIRSPEAPETERLRFTLPAGAKLRATDDGGAEVVREGKRLTAILPPSATDAQGEPVPMSFAVDEDVLEVHVAHRRGEVAYPVLADPKIEDWYNGGEAWVAGNSDLPGPSNPSNPWVTSANNGSFTFPTQHFNNCYGPGCYGLYVFAAPATYWGSWGQWNLWAPNTTAWITQAWLRGASARASGQTLQQHFGIWNSTAGRWTIGTGPEVWGATTTDYTDRSTWVRNDEGGPGRLLVASMWLDGFQTRARWSHVYFGGIAAELTDEDLPRITGVDSGLQPTGWVGSTSQSGTIRATDTGMGVARVSLHMPWWESPRDICSGIKSSRCGSSGDLTITYGTDSGSMPEGSNIVGASARDALWQWSGRINWQVKVDRSPPTLGPLSGALWDLRGQALTGDSYSVAASASDGYSGVGGIDLKVGAGDGTVVSQVPACTSDGCGQSGNLTWRPGELDNAGNRRWPDGIHTLQVQARDRTGSPGANKSAATRWDVIVDRDAPRLQSVTHSSLPTGWFDTQSPIARLTATDGGAGVKSFRLEAPSRGWTQNGRSETCAGTIASRCPTTPAPDDISYNRTGNQLPEGRVPIRARVDDAGNAAKSTTSFSWTARVDHSAPQADLSGTLWDRRNGALTDATYRLQIAATDNRAATTDPPADDQARSGVESIRVYVDGQTRPEWAYTATCDANGCPMRGSLGWDFNADEFTDGEHRIEVVTKDQLGAQPGHTRTDTFDVLVDRQPPSSVSVEHLGLPAGWFDNTTPTARITATDAGSGIRRFLLDSPDTDGDPANNVWRQEQSYDCGRDGQARCPKTRTGNISYNRADNPLPEGLTPLRAQAFDAADRGAAAPQTATAKVDRTPPSATVSGSLKDAENQTLYAGAYLLKVDGVDGKADPADNEPDTPRSGMKGIRIFVDDVLKDEATQPCEAGSCAMSRIWAFYPDQYGPGWHTIRVEARDQLGDEAGLAARHTTTQSFRVQVGDETARLQDRTGLENFYQYDSTETGAETRAHVNLATGNLVWHSVPIVNPGRGLSTVVNLTYNAQERVSDFFSTSDVLPYNQAGRGFSLAISGLTRVNEPLDLTAAPAGIVKLTDPDGTNHVFRQSRDGVTFLPPPGVNLHLRRFAPLTETDPVTGLPKPVIASKKAWAITRPDGVTYYFDQRGYPSSIEDRNANALAFHYRYRNKATGAVCDFVEANAGIPEAGPADDLVCKPWLESVEDAGGRDLTLTYEELAIAGTTTGVLPGKIKEIRDHAGRITSFDYDQDPLKGGDLVALTEAKGTSAERRFRFSYEPLGAATTGTPDRDLTSVTDPRGATTRVAYATYENLGSGAGTGQTTKRVDSITDRRGSLTDFDYGRIQEEPTQGILAHETAKVVDGRGYLTEYRLDRRARMVDMTDPRGAVTSLNWDEDNNATRVTQAAGTADEAVTQMEYNPNGLLTSSTRAAGTGDARRTELSYRDGAGTQLSARTPLVPPAPPTLPDQSVDAGLTFVSDLTSIRTPQGGTTTLAPDARGNVETTVDPEGHEVRTAYDAHGQVIEERSFDERKPSDPGASANLTTYSSYDANGLPELRTDPRGNETAAGGDGEWRYDYDEVGNLLKVTDPRGGGACTQGDSRERFTTKLTYDALDQLIEERIPKRSADCVFVTKKTSFDANGNVATTTDGEGAVSERSYTAMDELSEARSPAVAHHGEEDTASEVTRFYYDAEGNRVKEERPNGTKDRPAATANEPVSYSTSYRYDTVGQRIVETQHSRSATGAVDLHTSFAHDLRGNVIGVVDPRQNARYSETSPGENALIPGRRRLTLSYDKADNRTAQIEDPGGWSDRSEWRYDRDDNRTAQIDPRAFEDPAGDPDRYTTRFEYDRRDLLTAVIDANGNRTAFELRPDGRIASETKPKGTASAAAGDYETRYTYNANGELATRSLPAAADQYGPSDLKVSYRRDPVGDPVEITDARGNSFTNSFFDTGELRTTGRPSWWTVGADDNSDGVEGAAIRERTPEELGSDETEAQLPQSQGQGDFGAVDPEEMPDWLPKRGATSFAYDDEMRLTGITDVAGATSTLSRDLLGRVTQTRRPFDLDPEGTANDKYISESFTYDRHGNLRRSSDGEGHTTTLTYDQFDRPVEEVRPGSPEPEISKLGYDENGNLEYRETPRGPDFTERMAYDRLDRLTSWRNPAGEETTYGYDAAGNPTLERSPLGQAGSLEDGACDMASEALERDCFETERTYDALNQLTEERDGLGHVIRYGYDANGNEIHVDGPGARAAPGGALERQVINREFDGRDLLWTETTGAGDDRRTAITEFDANGNLSRRVNPAGVDETTRRPKFSGQGAEATREAEVREYSADNLLTSVLLPWGMRDAEDEKRYRQDFTLDERGRVESIDSPYRLGAAKTGRTSYTYFDIGWIRSQTDPALKDPDTNAPVYDQAMTYDYDRRGNQTLWRSSKGRKVTRDFFPSGTLRRREAFKTAADQTPRTYTYAYNPNRSRTQMVDDRPSGEDRTTNTRYDAAERETVVNEAWSKGKDTLTTYDKDGNPAVRYTDGRWSENLGIDAYAGGKKTSYRFDPLGRELETRVDPLGDKPARTTRTSYWPSGARQLRTKPNGVEESYYFNTDAAISRMRRQKPPAETFLKDQSYSYDRNGNRTRDERGTYDFNARDQLTRWTTKSGQTVSYELNGSGAITKKTDEREEEGGRVTTYTYIGDRLTKTVRGDATTTFDYDDFGAVNKIRVISEQGTQQPKDDTSRFDYDEFERMTNARGPGLESDTTYTYDGLDRRDSRCEGNSSANAETCSDGTNFDYSYVGASELLSQEQGGGKTSSYDYDSGGDSLGQTRSTADDPATYRSYAKDANGSIEGLEDSRGEFGGEGNPDRYEYDPYGYLENEDTLSEEAKANPLRFQGFYYDEGLKAYDMQARPYRPDVGRFMTQDRYESARGDYSLQSDPLTQNRYAFAGGNPVNRVEWDGHCSDACSGQGYAPGGGGDKRFSGGGGGGGGGGGSGGGGGTGGGGYGGGSGLGASGAAGGGRRAAPPRCRQCRGLQTEQGRQVRNAALGLGASRAGNVPLRDDTGFLDKWENGIGGELCYGIGICGPIGDPTSKTFHQDRGFYESPGGQALSILSPGPAGKPRAAKGLFGTLARRLGRGNRKGDTESIPRSLGAASRGEEVAKRLKLNPESPATRQVLSNLDTKVDDFIGQYRAGRIRKQFPGELLGSSVEEAIMTNSTARKLLLDRRFAK